MQKSSATAIYNVNFFRGRTPGPLALREGVKGGGNVGRRGKWKDVAGKGGEGGERKEWWREAPPQTKITTTPLAL